MIDFFLLKRQELERHLFGAHQIYESSLWLIWLSLCFLGIGLGPWWANLLLPALFSFWLAGFLAANFVRETRRFEWVDSAGIYLSHQPSLIGRFFAVVSKGLVVFIVLAIPIPDFGFWGFGWMSKVFLAMGAWIWLLAFLIRCQRLLWKIALWRCLLLVITGCQAALLPVGIAGMMGVYSRQGADLTPWHMFQQVEFFLSSIIVLLGIPSLFFVFWQFSLFHLKGSRKPEGQRRRCLMPHPLKTIAIKWLLLITLPWSCWQAVDDWNQKAARKMLYEGDVQGALDQIHRIPSGLDLGIPYRADYYDLNRLVQFHKILMENPIYLDHFSQLSQIWWQRHPQTKHLVSQLTVSRIQSAYLLPAEKLFISQIYLDENGSFTNFIRENHFIDEPVLNYIESLKP